MKQNFSETREKDMRKIMDQIRFDPGLAKPITLFTGGLGQQLVASKHDINSDLQVVSRYLEYVESKRTEVKRKAGKVYEEERKIDQRRSATLRATLGALKSIDKEFKILDQMVMTKGGMNSITLMLSLYLTDVQTDLQLHRAEVAYEHPKVTWTVFSLYDRFKYLGNSSGSEGGSTSSTYTNRGHSSGGRHDNGGYTAGGGGYSSGGGGGGSFGSGGSGGSRGSDSSFGGGGGGSRF